jgi:hypothetical protein
MDIVKELLNKTRLTPSEVTTVFNKHREIFGTTIQLCANCPSNVRAAVDRLKQYYNLK